MFVEDRKQPFLSTLFTFGCQVAREALPDRVKQLNIPLIAVEFSLRSQVGHFRSNIMKQEILTSVQCITMLCHVAMATWDLSSSSGLGCFPACDLRYYANSISSLILCISIRLLACIARVLKAAVNNTVSLGSMSFIERSLFATARILSFSST